jgi:hypothetical protein
LDGRLSGSSVQLNSQNAAPTIDMGTNPQLLNTPNITTINTNSTIKSLPNTYSSSKDFIDTYRKELDALIDKEKSKIIQDRNTEIKKRFDKYTGTWGDNQDYGNRVWGEQNLQTTFTLQLNPDKSCFGEINNKNVYKAIDKSPDINILYFKGVWGVSGDGIKVIVNPYKWVSKNLITNSPGSPPEIQTLIRRCDTNPIGIYFSGEEPSYQNNSKLSLLLMNSYAGYIKNLDGDSLGILADVRAVKIAKPLPTPSSVSTVMPARAVIHNIPPSASSSSQSIASNTLPTPNGSSPSGGPQSIAPDTTTPPSVTAESSQPSNGSEQDGVTSSVTDTSSSQSNSQDSLAAQDEALQKSAKLNHTSADYSSVPNIEKVRGDELFPQTRSRSMNASEVALMSEAKLQYAINEMYARYGLVFQNQSIQKQFEKFSWYQPNPSITKEDIISQFSLIESNNLELLLDALKSQLSGNALNNSTGTITPKKYSKSKIKIYSPHDKFPPDIIGKGVAGSFVVIQEAIGGGAMVVPAEDALFPLAARKFIIQNKSSGFPPGEAIPTDQQVRINYPPSNPLIIIGKGPLPGFYTVTAP